ncbi:MAG: pyrroline-5-carboxylate reductase [Acidimicrobiales bacterium]
MTRLALVGGGRMGEALLTGLLAAGWGEAKELAVVEALAARRTELDDRFPEVRVVAEPERSDGVVIAVKPDDVDAACRAARAAGCERVLSIAAGVTLARLEAALGPGVPVVRAMPNTPALVGAGAAAIAAGRHATDEDLDWAEGILAAVGTVVRVPEKLLDAVTGLSGSGPAYVFLVAEALIEAGVLVGLPRDTSQALVVQTLLGAGRLLAETGESPETLRAGVTSPGGTTAAGLRALEAAGVRSAFLDAVAAAAARSSELGSSPAPR